VNQCDFNANPTGCPGSLFDYVAKRHDWDLELFWYESEIVLDENLLDRTPLNPDNAENTYKVKPLKKTHKVRLRHEDDMSI